MITLLRIGTTEIIVIVLLVLLLFGGRKIPELMKGLGKGVRSFKEGMNEVDKVGEDTPGSSAQQDETHSNSGTPE
ncbi:MAG: twin-arginine translocase TatA/TatE family subunit [Bacteroidales bacterium]|nr:twin-arginine translocase TatA/TatE family subunit [Bacteroidales bacterium]